VPVLPDTKIGDWTITLLTKFLEDWFRNHPLPPVNTLQVDALKVNQSLEIVNKVFFDALDIHIVGGMGEPAFQNSWVFFGAPYSQAGYYKDPIGVVHLVGVIKSGTVGSPAFTLPPGYRPEVTPGPFAVFSGSANSIGRVDVGTDGTVTPQLPSSNASVSLEGISFQAA